MQECPRLLLAQLEQASPILSVGRLERNMLYLREPLLWEGFQTHRHREAKATSADPTVRRKTLDHTDFRFAPARCNPFGAQLNRMNEPPFGEVGVPFEVSW
jgi:hypothetical protein